MNHTHCVICTSYSNEQVGEQIIKTLMNNKLAACIHVQEVQSYYHWNRAVQSDTEKVLYIKTRSDLYDKVQSTIKSCHDYDLPEIIQLPITKGLPAYLQWIDKSCTHSE